MWNFKYQKARVAIGKKLRHQAGCCEHCMVGLFKHLIHIFALTFCFALAGMIIVVSQNQHDDIGLGPEPDKTDQIMLLDSYMKNNPGFYGISKVSQAFGFSFNTTEGLLSFSERLKKKQEGDAAPELVIHPKYYELQKKAVFVHDEWKIIEVDMLKDTIGLHQFYTDHLSKSYPIVLRNDASDWEFKKIVDAKF